MVDVAARPKFDLRIINPKIADTLKNASADAVDAIYLLPRPTRSRLNVENRVGLP